MSRKIGSVILSVVAFSILGAGGDTITEKNVTPNPGGAAQTVSGNGIYTLGTNNGKQNTLAGVAFNAENTGTKQLSTNQAKAAGGNWSGTLQVVTGNYDCYGTLGSTNGGNLYLTDSNVINVNVK